MAAAARARAPLAVGAVLSALALALSGCADGASRGPAGTPVPPPAAAGQGAVGAAATTTPAAELRAGLTWLMVERAQLLAEGRAAVLAGASADARLQAVRDRLDEVDDETARRVAGRPAPVLAALRAEVDVALAPRLDAPALSAAHRATVDALAGQVPGLAADRLLEALDRSTARLGGSPPRSDARGAGTAAGLLANGVAAQRGLGSTETSAVVLRSDLTTLLVARVWLAGDAAQAEALDQITLPLASRLAGPQDDGDPALVVPLRAGHAALTAAAQAARDGDAARADQARSALAAADRDLTTRLARAVPALPVALVRRELDPTRGPLLAAVGARARGDVDAAALSSAVAQRAVATAAVLAAALADQQRLS